MNKQNGEGVEKVLRALRDPISRRDFLKVGGIGSLGVLIPQIMAVQVVAASAPATTGAESPDSAAAAPEANAKGMVIAIPSRCTGCRRCEIACSSFNDGKVSSTISRIKVNRNYQFGPKGAQLGYWRGEGQYGNFLLIQDTCRQCAHPIPCATVCPNGAIEVTGPANARVVNTSKCTGCRLCQAACPWAMMSFDEQLNKSTKCHLCNGSPECVKACPSNALQYVPWTDKSKDMPVRWTVPASISTPPNVASTCNVCHK